MFLLQRVSLENNIIFWRRQLKLINLILSVGSSLAIILIICWFLGPWSPSISNHLSRYAYNRNIWLAYIFEILPMDFISHPSKWLFPLKLEIELKLFHNYLLNVWLQINVKIQDHINHMHKNQQLSTLNRFCWCFFIEQHFPLDDGRTDLCLYVTLMLIGCLFSVFLPIICSPFVSLSCSPMVYCSHNNWSPRFSLSARRRPKFTAIYQAVVCNIFIFNCRSKKDHEIYLRTETYRVSLLHTSKISERFFSENFWEII